MTELIAGKERKRNQDREIKLFIEALKKQPLVLEEWDERLWVAILDWATVFRDGRMVFRFKSGSEIEVEHEESTFLFFVWCPPSKKATPYAVSVRLYQF